MYVLSESPHVASVMIPPPFFLTAIHDAHQRLHLILRFGARNGIANVLTLLLRRSILIFLIPP